MLRRNAECVIVARRNPPAMTRHPATNLPRASTEVRGNPFVDRTLLLICPNGFPDTRCLCLR